MVAVAAAAVVVAVTAAAVAEIAVAAVDTVVAEVAIVETAAAAVADTTGINPFNQLIYKSRNLRDFFYLFTLHQQSH